MPIYHYEALDRTRKKRKGMIEANSEKEAKEKLRHQGVMVTKFFSSPKKISQIRLQGDNLITFTLQLSQLTNAQVPLYESLLTLEEQYRQEKFHPLLLSLCNQVKGGTPLSEAMGSFPDSFDSLYCAMIKAGESVGALHIVLEKLSGFLSKQMKLKKQISTAMIYPSILACFSFLVIGILLGFVIPSIQEIFQGQTLNGFTKAILSISYLFRNFWWLYLPLFVGAAFLLYFQMRSLKGQLFIEKLGLRLPIFKKVMTEAAIARFCRTMGTLQEGGMTIVDSLQIAKKVMRNHTLEDVMDRAELKIMEGSSLSKELLRSPWIPLMVSRMLAVGEESGNVTLMMNKIADLYEDELDKSLQRLLALAQPLILIFMGGVIGIILLAVLLPLTDVSSLTI